MPRFIPPKRSTPHRVAAIALYRALLSRCATAPLPHDYLDALSNAVRNKFRRERKMQSPYQLGLAFRAGYEVLDHLDAASNGDQTSTAFLISFIPKLPPGMTRPPPVRPRTPPPDPSKKLLKCLPPERAILNVRPYAKVSGARKVPILASANGVPFLRLGKPQPPNLSRILRQKLEQRQVTFDQKIELANYWQPIATQEETWDDIIAEHFALVDGKGEGNQEPTWTQAIAEAERINTAKHDHDMASDRVTARRMQKIVDQETALALQEGQTIIRGRRVRHPKTP
ncbi:hypothetical protein BCR34DRAFT_629022 [Clohesyomyces aquaticus]|uniref:Complex 1 LYR protein domain-containing protein n=1 Tax=Clohesyomyces aquaticus TaxID=1231657 RepID=A0A1Y1YBV6_9PLEO|nr:hypothetical protein BCR34DRAFT_629022 [Clohesyomyces aquaticus]